MAASLGVDSCVLSSAWAAMTVEPEKTVKSRNHIYVLELSAVSQMAHLQTNVFFQQDDVPPD
jgi:hypothetical protein